MIPLTQYVRVVKFMETESSGVVARGWMEEVIALWGTDFLVVKIKND